MSFQYTPLFLIVLLLGTVFTTSCLEKREAKLIRKIIAMEKAALDRWGRGDPWGYTEISADDVTCFDTGTERRMDGLQALKKYYKTLEGRMEDRSHTLVKTEIRAVNPPRNNSGDFLHTIFCLYVPSTI